MRRYPQKNILSSGIKIFLTRLESKKSVVRSCSSCKEREIFKAKFYKREIKLFFWLDWLSKLLSYHENDNVEKIILKNVCIFLHFFQIWEEYATPYLSIIWAKIHTNINFDNYILLFLQINCYFSFIILINLKYFFNGV